MQPLPPPRMPAVMSSSEGDPESEDEGALVAPENREGEWREEGRGERAMEGGREGEGGGREGGKVGRLVE